MLRSCPCRSLFSLSWWFLAPRFSVVSTPRAIAISAVHAGHRNRAQHAAVDVKGRAGQEGGFVGDGKRAPHSRTSCTVGLRCRGMSAAVAARISCGCMPVASSFQSSTSCPMPVPDTPTGQTQLTVTLARRQLARQAPWSAQQPRTWPHSSGPAAGIPPWTRRNRC